MNDNENVNAQEEEMQNLINEVVNKGVEYECGECARKVFLKPQDPVRCGECGHRILYKPRTRRNFRKQNRAMFIFHCYFRLSLTFESSVSLTMRHLM
eukprot:snap_masked-scaffold_6-processed-gene-1.21-mRNA-1 protein AED:0.26 eAED:0.26 QI:0/0/0/0.5/1/1/2/0/96